MPNPKRGGGYLTRSSIKRRNSDNGGGEATESLISGDVHGHSNEDVSTIPSDEVMLNLSKSIVSIVLINDHGVFFACSGIAIERQVCVTRFLTSASLVRAYNDARKGDTRILKIEVWHKGTEMHKGVVAEYNLDQNFAVVNVTAFLDVHLVLFKRVVGTLPHNNVIAAHGIRGKVVTRCVMLATDFNASEDSQGLILPSDGIYEAWDGGALFDFDGNFVGMIIYSRERSVFVSWGMILKRLEKFWRSQMQSVERIKRRKEAMFGERPSGYSESRPEGDMVLVNTFEDTFGDALGKAGESVWSEISKKVSSNINRNVVALASFDGETMVFACTGFFIEWKGCEIVLTSASLVRDSGDENKINENLRIEVVLSNNRHREGTLQHYNLHYNVALVSVKDCRLAAILPADTRPPWRNSSEVLAVGRGFKSGTVMASSGLLVGWSGTLDCKTLSYSSCKTSKAGIGGPLVSFDGKVIGMNFYEMKEGTPLLFWHAILSILTCFEGEKSVAEIGNYKYVSSGVPCWKRVGDKSERLNRWPLPMPYWRRRDEPESEDKNVGTFGGLKYGFINGMKFYYD